MPRRSNLDFISYDEGEAYRDNDIHFSTTDDGGIKVTILNHTTRELQAEFVLSADEREVLKNWLNVDVMVGLLLEERD